MSTAKKTYWKGLTELTHSADNKNIKESDKAGFVEPGDDDDLGHSRRDFLKMMGFSLAAASAAACEAPVRKAIPFVNKPLDVNPGIANYYATTFVNGGNYCGIVAKVRDGRPINIEGNKLCPVTGGGSSAQVQASVLSLYDDNRLRGPKVNGEAADWAQVDAGITGKLKEISASNGKIRLVSNTLLSPGTQAAIDAFLEAHPTARHIQYDPVSNYGIAKANESQLGVAMIPSYDFGKARVIVSVAADFLATWVAPITFSAQYAQNRKVEDATSGMSRHFQFEARLSLTGANADYRAMIKPSQEGSLLVQLYNLLAAKAGVAGLPGGLKDIQYLTKAADELWANRGASLLVAGSNDVAVQQVANAINHLLGNYGVTILPDEPLAFRKGNDAEMDAFVTDLTKGGVDGVVFYNCNPVYDHPQGSAIGKALSKLKLSVSTSMVPDETASLSAYMAPDHHYLEAWNDFAPRKGCYSLSQPTISPLFKTRQGQESLMTWAGKGQVDYFAFLKESWKSRFYSNQAGTKSFQQFWDQCLHDGVYQHTAASTGVSFKGTSLTTAASTIASTASKANGLELIVFEGYTVGEGTMANNPLLHELPDPITKAVWDHYVMVAPADAESFGIVNDAEGRTQLVTLTANGHTVTLPALVQPGQKAGTASVALGFGRTKAGLVADGIGVNAYPFMKFVNGTYQYSLGSKVTLAKQDDDFQIAQTQIHQTYMGRQNVIQETVLEDFKQHPESFKEEAPKVSNWDDKVAPSTLSLWKGHEYKDHHWAMAIDLNACNGCGACVVACNVENNVALVGKEEVINRREMHWMRIDRYYSSPANTASGDNEGLSEAAENPEVVFQPMLCQHCNNAPCETVCPVAATTHSSEGLNQMTYNRCIGTRYCANNCPYKVRRFNWFKYHTNKQFLKANPAMNTDLGRMVLNPDVTVRSRGVMEKCSFCVQRIQESKLKAKREKRKMEDGEVVTACQASCTAGAIVFGDINMEESKISKLLDIQKDKEKPNSIDKTAKNPRAYRVLEEIGVKPNIFYLTKIRNKDLADSQS